MNICYLCKLNHDLSHYIINFDEKNYICEIHKNHYISYCKNCNIDICELCKIPHKSHEVISYK